MSASSNRHWLAQAVIIHECTGGFLRWVLMRYLPQYEWHSLVSVKTPEGRRVVQGACNDPATEAFLLNPFDFGWPLNRPRLFTVGTLKGTCYLNAKPDGQSGLIEVQRLFQSCTLDCRSLFVAPQDSRLFVKDSVAQSSPVLQHIMQYILLTSPSTHNPTTIYYLLSSTTTTTTSSSTTIYYYLLLSTIYYYCLLLLLLTTTTTTTTTIYYLLSTATTTPSTHLPRKR